MRALRWKSAVVLGSVVALVVLAAGQGPPPAGGPVPAPTDASPAPDPSSGPGPGPGLDPADACDHPGRLPAADRCAFIQEHCEYDTLLPYTVWYHCNVAPRGAAAVFFYAVALALLLPLLFTLLGDTAELYFSPIMTHVAQAIPKMRPRFAGVTFVAIGNGAPDLSANITAIRGGDVLLSAGALTGAAMFVQCVVASEVMRASGGPVKCRGATLRDCAAYSAAILLVLAAFAHGRISYWFLAAAALLYVGYVAWVFAGDEWHERGRPRARSVWGSFRGALADRLFKAEPVGMRWAAVEPDDAEAPGHRELSAPLVPYDSDGVPAAAGGGGGAALPGSPGTGGAGTGGGGRPHPAAHLVAARRYHDLVWADLNPEEHEEDQAGRRQQQQQQQQGRGHMRDSRRRGRRRGQQGAGGAAGATARAGAGAGAGPLGHVELGPAGSGAVAAPGTGAGGSIARSGSQLVTLSYRDGTALPAPAPLEAAPAAAPWGAADGVLPTAAADGAVTNGVGGGVPRKHSGGALLPPAAAWGRRDSGVDGGSDGGGRDSYDGSSGSEDGGGGGGDAASVASSRAGLLAGEGEGHGEGGRPRNVWEAAQDQLTMGAAAEWRELPPSSLRRRWRTLTFPLLLPAYTALRTTIPFVDPATYSRPWLIATCLGAPILAAGYLGTAASVAGAAAALAAGGALAAAVSYFTAGEDNLPDWDFGTGFAFGPACFAVFGFFMGVIWIDTFASEVVGIIALLAGLMHVPPSVMGLTLLAWGSSLGDFFGNPAMARRGAPSMALTACFAGPLFNILASLGLGFASYFARHRVSSAEVSLRPEVALGCVALVGYNAAVAAAGLWNGGELPPRFYLFARAWYGTYFVAACVLGLAVGGGGTAGGGQ